MKGSVRPPRRAQETRQAPGFRLCGAYAAILAACALLTGLPAAGAQGVTSAPTLADCEQDNVASLSVRACTYFLSYADIEPAERLRILNLRGRSWLTEDDPESAAEDFSNALKIDPANVEALKGRVKAYDLLQKFDLAVQDWTSLIAMFPQDDKLFRQRGASYSGARDYSLALADYNRSLELNPKGLDAYIGRAQVYDAMGERDKALKEFEAGIAIDEQYLLLFWERARMADRWGERQMAINDYIAVLKINGHWANARKHLERLGVYSPY
jgi:tetratricopeptide (TPR) repeat protein